ncbi:swr complex subunit [Scheffersomyces spartinae]|uniref:SWR1-complex protein 5 n=1 Tax=Scheffersomyces spartinae TaxID=45513 RepID=A0A9P7VDQ5_9ASCO|nr:swr complex subunit [Scheffersomyces spartinae]KAG7195807.1 swr complex subunit [Scheffersomyces spartinae]
MAARKTKSAVKSAATKKSAHKKDITEEDGSTIVEPANGEVNKMKNTEEQNEEIVIERENNEEKGEKVEQEAEEDEEDSDYDPNAVQESDSEGESDEDKSEYSKIESASVSQVRTRFQRQLDAGGSGDGSGSLVANNSKLDLDSIFATLNDKTISDEWKRMVTNVDTEKSKGIRGTLSSLTSIKEPLQELQQQSQTLEKDKIRIETTYTFAGKIITESKLVDADSAEARVYQNSTDLINKSSSESMKGRRSFIPVIRTIPGESEPVALRIKLKRPSLIDKFLDTYLNKKLKLSTLEKSRLDWASFVDKKQIQDELRVANKAGYLDKQDFLHRVEWKRDEQYKKAKELDRQQKLKEEQSH